MDPGRTAADATAAKLHPTVAFHDSGSGIAGGKSWEGHWSTAGSDDVGVRMLGYVINALGLAAIGGSGISWSLVVGRIHRPQQQHKVPYLYRIYVYVLF